MSFGNFRLARLEPNHWADSSSGYGFGRSFERRGRLGRDIEPTREASATYSGKSKTDLSVVTAEGDRVTISLAAQVKYAASSRTGPDGSSLSVSASSSSQLRVAVEGDLSEAELKDLGTLLSNLAQATSQAQSGDVATPVPTAPDTGFAGLASLAAFAYSYKETVQAGTRVHTTG